MDKEGVLLVEIWDNTGKQIFKDGEIEKFPEEFQKRSRENFTLKKLRNAFRENGSGSIRIIIDNTHELFQGDKAVQRTCFIYLSLIPKFRQIEQSEKQSSDAILRRFTHNLIKFQTRFKDHFIRLVPDKFRGKTFEELRNEVRRRIEENVPQAAYDVSQLSHRATDLDAQIETLRIISGFADNTGRPLAANIKKALYRLSNPFFEELKAKGVRLIFDIDEALADRYRVKIVYDLFNAAMWQFFDNACKYSMKNTDIVITADLKNNKKKVIIKMVSICIEPGEEESIFLERYRGRNVRDNEEGSGIGMFIARKALKLMRADIHVTNDSGEGDGVYADEKKYSPHTFTIEFSQ